MKKEDKLTEDLNKSNSEESIHDKLDDFILHLSSRQWEEEVLLSLDTKFSRALKSASEVGPISDDSQYADPTIESSIALDKIILATSTSTPTHTKNSFYKTLSLLVKVVIACLLILLGFGMIIMPAPEYFEMFTLFYFSPEDGVTIMDIVSLIVAFSGIAILLSVSLKRK